MIRSSFGSRGLANYRWYKLAESLGEAHPATRAAYGRLLFWRGHTPQRGARTIEAIAWHRESGAQPGYKNRSARKVA